MAETPVYSPPLRPRITLNVRTFFDSILSSTCRELFFIAHSVGESTNNPAIVFFACGTSYGIMAIDKFLDPVWITPPILASAGRIPETCPRDIFALQFLAETPSVLLSGGRLGLLHINDLRIGNSFEKNLDWIYHPSSITHIKQIDPHRIIVAGLNSSLRQYDLRYRKADTIIPKNHGRGTPTRSIVQYPDYFNTATVECGFDVDVESGIVAVSQVSHFLLLFSINWQSGSRSIPAPYNTSH